MNSRKIFLTVSLLTTISVVISSCYKDKEELLYSPDCSNPSKVAGPNFTAVKNIIIQNCSGCHLNGNIEGGYAFDSDCDIVNNWNLINGDCVNYTPHQMPTSQPLSDSDKTKITNWVNAGHKYTD